MNRYDWLNGYLLSKPGATADFKTEWQWQRYQVGGRLFAATLCPRRAVQRRIRGP